MVMGKRKLSEIYNTNGMHAFRLYLLYAFANLSERS